ncbi:hypothetical protein ACTXT7_004222 [Hymenolepis weldensis]
MSSVSQRWITQYSQSAEVKVLSARIEGKYTRGVPITSNSTASNTFSKHSPSSPVVPLSPMVLSTETPVEVANDYMKLCKNGDKKDPESKVKESKSLMDFRGNDSNSLALSTGLFFIGHTDQQGLPMPNFGLFQVS